MLTEYKVKNCKSTRKVSLSVPYITFRFGTVRTVQNLLDVSYTVYENAATMFTL